jgi:hypothetical protein
MSVKILIGSRERAFIWQAPSRGNPCANLQITKAKLNPSQPTPEQLALFAGDYGDRRVTLEQGTLLYKRSGPQYRLIPLTETLFALDGYDNFWLEFVSTDGKVTAVVGLYEGGQREPSPRSK